MKNETFTKLIALMMVFSCMCISCSKDGDDDDIIDQTEEQLPANKEDAEAKIKGKWEVSASGEVRSLEFIEGNTYILEVSASSSLVSRQSPLSSRAALARNEGGLKAETTETGSTQRISGKFTISADGQSIMLDNIAQITISGISEESFTFNIKFTEDNRELSVTTTIASAVDASNKTTLLARNWGFPVWADYDLPNREIFESHGFKPQDQGLTFTASGTMIMRYISFLESSIVDPETGQVSEVITDLSLESDIYSWKWKDSQQTVITITSLSSGGDDPFDITIESLTESSLSAALPNGNTWVLMALQ